MFWTVKGIETAEEERAEVVRASTGDRLYAVGYHHQGGERCDLVRPTDLTTRPSLTAGDWGERMSLAAALVNSGRPVIGRYSWSVAGSVVRISVACVRAK